MDNLRMLIRTVNHCCLMDRVTGFGFHLVETQPGHESTELHRHYQRLYS